LFNVQVTDKDTGRNAKVEMKITGGNKDNTFRIDPDSGLLYTQAKLDAERKSRYVLKVSALDMANTGSRKQSSARVSIFVEDANDNAPQFDERAKEIFFKENEPAGTRVIKLTAKDADSGENARITYSVANVDADSLPFEVDQFTGVVKSRQVIDYESDRRKYVMRVRASDWGKPFRRETELKLTIHIQDINDNRPQVLFNHYFSSIL
jgi:protocadherin Fat 1/2/3